MSTSEKGHPRRSKPFSINLVRVQVFVLHVSIFYFALLLCKVDYTLKVTCITEKWVLPKTGITGHFGAKKDQSKAKIAREEPCSWPASHRTCFGLEIICCTWFFLICLAFNCLCRIVNPIRGHTLLIASSPTPPTRCLLYTSPSPRD